MKNGQFFETIPDVDREAHRDTPIEQLPPAVLAGMFREMVDCYAAMSAAAGFMRDHIEAAVMRLDEGHYDKAAQTIRRAAVMLADAEAPQKSGGA